MPDFINPYAHGLTDEDVITVTRYSGGGKKVDWPIEGPDILPDEFEEIDSRSIVRNDLARCRRSNEQSKKSRLRAAWTLSNAVTDWGYMTTLTYPKSRVPKSYEETSKHRRAFLKRAKKTFPDLHVGWILEFTKKQAAHYHIFWGGEMAEKLDQMPTETFEGQRFDGRVRDRIVVRGELDNRIQSWWSNQAGDGSPEFKRFQAGGITELITNPDGAGKYVAKEAGKRSQKIAPFLVGQWWDVTRKVRPEAIEQIEITVGDYVAVYGPTMHRHLFV